MTSVAFPMSSRYYTQKIYHPMEPIGTERLLGKVMGDISSVMEMS